MEHTNPMDPDQPGLLLERELYGPPTDPQDIMDDEIRMEWKRLKEEQGRSKKEKEKCTIPNQETIARIQNGEDPMYDENWNSRPFKEYMQLVWTLQSDVRAELYAKYYDTKPLNPFVELVIALGKSALGWAGLGFK